MLKTTGFIRAKYLPKKMVIQDPSKMVQIDVERLYDHWYKMVQAGTFDIHFDGTADGDLKLPTSKKAAQKQSHVVFDDDSDEEDGEGDAPQEDVEGEKDAENEDDEDAPEEDAEGQKDAEGQNGKDTAEENVEGEKVTGEESNGGEKDSGENSADDETESDNDDGMREACAFMNQLSSNSQDYRLLLVSVSGLDVSLVTFTAMHVLTMHL